MATVTQSSSFTVDLTEINEAAYFMQYEAAMLANSKFNTKVGGGQKGSSVWVPYYDPTAIATAASSLTEADDFTNWRQLTNASVQITASEFGTGIFLTDIVNEDIDETTNVNAEIGRQLGLSAGRARELNILAAMSSGFTTGTITGTNSEVSSTSSYFTYSKYMAAHSVLDGKILTVPGRKLVVTHPYTWYYTAQSTISETYASSMGKVGDDVIDRFYVTTLFGDTDIYTSNYITASSNAVGFMYVKDALGYWEPRSIRIEEERNASARGDEFVCTLRGGAAVMISSYGARLLQYGSAPS